MHRSDLYVGNQNGSAVSGIYRNEGIRGCENI
ncbi:hypothetical protein SAMN04488574_101621 [Bacillus sp. 71mf]|nr:hypothetical protein SAMN04488574_101621 [Bacillus sp. 71mf]SFS76146.1 hypothetical protein SAMN04488145_103156 [Bacillus sp. 103mf]